MQSSQSLAGRALLAVGLMIGFYLMAIAIAAALLYVPYATWVLADRIDGRVTLFCLGGAGLILWSIVPRPDRFEAPGPALADTEHPRLFSQLREIAAATEQTMPREVYLVGDVNAWVSSRGGVMGFGSRRVMGLGLPLLQMLNVSEFRAVLAHEFGHYHGGDTKLGPWIYKTRASIGRTIQALAGHSSVLTKPFLWYGNAFLKITHAVSRRQELAADALAARVEGPAALESGLKRIHGSAAALVGYWSQEVAPLLNQGFLPPLADGFRRFLAAPGVAAQVDEILKQEMEQGKGDPYDTHPPLRERVAALQAMPQQSRPAADAPAVSLLDDLAAVERRWLDTASGGKGAELKSVAWEGAGSVWTAIWTEQSAPYLPALQGTVVSQLPALFAEASGIGDRFRTVDRKGLDADERRQHVVSVVGCAFAGLLARRGWRVAALPGEAVVFEHQGRTLKPFWAVSQIAAGELTAESWARQCEEAGIADAALAPAAAGT